MERVPTHPLYAHPTSPTSLFKEMASGVMPIGDPYKAGRALMTIASLPNPPGRIQLGTESVTLIRKKAEKTIEDAFTYESISHSTNREGIDGHAAMKG